MRWIKHPSSFCRSEAMTEVREALGTEGYGAVWLLLERIAESWEGKNDPELRVSISDWKRTCGISPRKLQVLLEILQEHGIIFAENDQNKLRLAAPIIVEFKDESTRKALKNSGIAPESFRKDSGLQTEQEAEKYKDKQTQPPPPNLRLSLMPVLSRHGIAPDSERGRRLIRHIEGKHPNNPGGYLESILQKKPYFDPATEESMERANNKAQGPITVGEVLCGMGLVDSSRGAS
jgi:hypothetical protein